MASLYIVQFHYYFLLAVRISNLDKLEEPASLTQFLIASVILSFPLLHTVNTFRWGILKLSYFLLLVLRTNAVTYNRGRTYFRHEPFFLFL